MLRRIIPLKKFQIGTNDVLQKYKSIIQINYIKIQHEIHACVIN